MKKNYHFMTSRELKHFTKQLEDQYGAVPDTFKTFAFVQGKEKIYAVSRGIETVDLDALRINSIGVYIAEAKNDQLRLSIEGSQLLGPVATKNVIELSDEHLRLWFKGEDLPLAEERTGFVILKHGSDYVGSGTFKDGRLFNFVPKARRIHEMHSKAL